MLFMELAMFGNKGKGNSQVQYLEVQPILMLRERMKQGRMA